MAMLRTLGWFTEILIASLFSQLCDHAVQQFWAHKAGAAAGSLQPQLFAPEIPWIVREAANYNPTAARRRWRGAEEVRAELRSAVSEADVLLGEFQRRRGARGSGSTSFCGDVLRLLCGREEVPTSDEELQERTRAVRWRLRELAGAVDEEVVEFGIGRSQHEAADGWFFRRRSKESRRREKCSALGIAGVALTYLWWVGYKTREFPGISLIPSSLLEHLYVHFG